MLRYLQFLGEREPGIRVEHWGGDNTPQFHFSVTKDFPMRCYLQPGIRVEHWGGTTPHNSSVTQDFPMRCYLQPFGESSEEKFHPVRTTGPQYNVGGAVAAFFTHRPDVVAIPLLEIKFYITKRYVHCRNRVWYTFPYNSGRCCVVEKRWAVFERCRNLAFFQCIRCRKCVPHCRNTCFLQ